MEALSGTSQNSKCDCSLSLNRTDNENRVEMKAVHGTAITEANEEFADDIVAPLPVRPNFYSIQNLIWSLSQLDLSRNFTISFLWNPPANQFLHFFYRTAGICTMMRMGNLISSTQRPESLSGIDPHRILCKNSHKEYVGMEKQILLAKCRLPRMLLITFSAIFRLHQNICHFGLFKPRPFLSEAKLRNKSRD